MPKLDRETAARVLDLWYDAQLDPLGILIRTPNHKRLVGALYAVRQDANDPLLDRLAVSITQDDPPLVMIYHKSEVRDAEEV